MWLTTEDVERLSRLRSLTAGEPVLSIYVPVELGLGVPRGYVAAAMDALRELREASPEHEHARLEAESQRVLSFLRQEAEPAGRTIALFSSVPGRIFEVLALQVALPALARFEKTPYFAPLDAALDDFPRVAIAAVDERQARILTTFLGEITSTKQLKDSVPGRQRQGGWSAFRYERDRAQHVVEHLRHVAGELERLFREMPFKRLVIGASAETAAALRDALPANLQERVAGAFAAEMFAADQDLIDAALPIAEAAERNEETELVREIQDRALAGQAAALGWDETLQALREGRAHRLAIGAHHMGTGRGDAALGLAWKTGAGVEFIRGEAEELLGPDDAIGALLRY